MMLYSRSAPAHCYSANLEQDGDLIGFFGNSFKLEMLKECLHASHRAAWINNDWFLNIMTNLRHIVQK